MAAEKNEHSCSQDSNNHTGKFVYPLSIFSFLICITAMVRVEIINQRIDVVEDFMAEVNQIAKVHVGRDVTDLKNVRRVNLVDEFYRKNGVKEEEYTSKAPPRVRLSPGPIHAKTGQNIRLPRCHVTGFPLPTVIWTKLTGRGVLPQNRVTLFKESMTIHTAIKSDSGSYECKATNRLGQASATTTLVVLPPPKFITRPPRSAVKTPGGDFSLDCFATEQASISWRRIGGTWEEGRMKVRNGTLTIHNLKKSDSGNYVCEANLLNFYRIETRTILNVIEFRAVFTNHGASGRLGPTSLGSYYSGQVHDGQVTLVSGIQQWTVPHTGDYRIEAIGAAGGYGLNSNNGQYRGRGARIKGTFRLSKGETIQILIGQEGSINLINYSSGGGGGTFVVRGSNTPLIIAGGGGGMERASSRHSGCDASTGTTGNPGYRSWSGGSGGQGATTADNENSGGGGGGFFSSGRSSTQFGGSMGNGGEGGKGFLQGGVGGRALYDNAVGGFGGGGGAYGLGGGAGGGGGYSGGSSGGDEYDSCGGWGGSYSAGKNQQNEML